MSEERAKGIGCCLQWADKADKVVFYIDIGWSKGMLAAKDRHEKSGIPYEARTIGFK